MAALHGAAAESGPEAGSLKAACSQHCVPSSSAWSREDRGLSPDDPAERLSSTRLSSTPGGRVEGSEQSRADHSSLIPGARRKSR